MLCCMNWFIFSTLTIANNSMIFWAFKCLTGKNEKNSWFGGRTRSIISHVEIEDNHMLWQHFGNKKSNSPNYLNNGSGCFFVAISLPAWCHQAFWPLRLAYLGTSCCRCPSWSVPFHDRAAPLWVAVKIPFPPIDWHGCDGYREPWSFYPGNFAPMLHFVMQKTLGTKAVFRGNDRCSPLFATEEEQRPSGRNFAQRSCYFRRNFAFTPPMPSPPPMWPPRRPVPTGWRACEFKG